MKFWTVLIPCALAMSAPLCAETLTNADVLTLLDAGLGDEAVIAKIESFQPKLIAFTAKRPAQVFMKSVFGRSAINYGLQPEIISSTAIFVLPSSSGLAIRWWEPKWWFDAADLHRKFS